MALKVTEGVLRLRDEATGVLRRFQKTMKVTGRSTERAASRMIRAFTAFRGSLTGSLGALLSLKGAIAGAGFGFLTKSILDAAGAVETATARLVGIRGGLEEATEAMAFFQEVAAAVPFTLEEVIEAGVSLEAFGARSEDTLVAVADLAGFMGVTIPEAARAFGRAFAGGAGAADVLRERGVLALVKLRAGIDDLKGTSLPAFRKALLEAMRDPTGPIAGAAKRMAETWTGQISIMQDAIFNLKLTIAEAGLLEFAKEVVTVLTQEIKILNESLIESRRLMEDTGEGAEAAAEGMGFLANLAVAARNALLGLELVATTAGAGISLAGAAVSEVGRAITGTTEEINLLLEAAKGFPIRFEQIRNEMTANVAGLRIVVTRTGDFTKANIQLAKELARTTARLKEQSKALGFHAERIAISEEATKGLRDGLKVIAEEFFNAGESGLDFARAATAAAADAEFAFRDALDVFKQLPDEMRQTVSEAVLAIDPEKIARRVEVFIREISRIQIETARAAKKATDDAVKGAEAIANRFIKISTLLRERGSETVAFLDSLNAAFQANTVQSFSSAAANIEAFTDRLTELGEEELARRRQVQEGTALLIGSTFATITKLTETFGKQSVGLQKANAVAQIIISTAVAIMRAFEQLGPLGGPAAAVLAAIGAAQIATVLAARPGGGRGAVSVGGGGGGPAGAPAAPPPEVMARPPSVVNISIQGFVGDEATLGAELHRLLREAEGDGVQVSVL